MEKMHGAIEAAGNKGKCVCMPGTHAASYARGDTGWNSAKLKVYPPELCRAIATSFVHDAKKIYAKAQQNNHVISHALPQALRQYLVTEIAEQQPGTVQPDYYAARGT